MVNTTTAKHRVKLPGDETQARRRSVVAEDIFLESNGKCRTPPMTDANYIEEIASLLFDHGDSVPELNPRVRGHPVRRHVAHQLL